MQNLKASTIIEKLTDLFCMFGLPSYEHTDQGTNLCVTNLNCGCPAWVFLLAGLAGIILEAKDKSNVITVLFGKPSFWLYV